MKIIQKNIFFHEIDTNKIVNSTVILDIDGTLMCSSQRQISKCVIDKVRALEKNNTVYIFSNNYNTKRNKVIAKSIEVAYIKAPHKKPNKKIMKYIKETCPVVIVGDKYLTDGLFAQFIGASHIRVKRYKCKEDSLWDVFACAFDDACYFFVKLLRIAK